MDVYRVTLYEKYLFQLMNALENAFLIPTAPDQKIAYRNMKRYLAHAELARQNLNLISKVANVKYGQNTFAPYILLKQGNC